MPKPAAAIALALALLAPACKPRAQEDYPLAKGNYWVFTGPVTWTESPNTVKTKTVTWRVDVLDTAEREGVTGFLIKGDPLDLAWYRDSIEPRQYALLRVGKGKYYKVDAEAFQELRDGARPAASLFSEGDLKFDFPLVAGKTYGTDQPRADRLYAWYVEKDNQVVYGSLADRVRIRFEPGVGPVAYEYEHHGTVARLNMKLVDHHFEKE